MLATAAISVRRASGERGFIKSAFVLRTTREMSGADNIDRASFAFFEDAAETPVKMMASICQAKFRRGTPQPTVIFAAEYCSMSEMET